jgi:hypothetical protein
LEIPAAHGLNLEESSPDTLVTIPLEVRRAGDFIHSGKDTGWGFLLIVFALAEVIGGPIHKWNSKKLAR